MDERERAKLLASYPPDTDWFLEFVEARQDATETNEQLQKARVEVEVLTKLANTRLIRIDELEQSIATMVQGWQDEDCVYQAKVDELRKELIDITARSIKGRMEAWDLIDKMLPYVKGQLDTHSVNSMDLLAEIEEKRKPRDQ
jgi:hypothetical protein